MDPIWNCALAVCCPPFSEQRYRAIATLLSRDGMNVDEALVAAPYIARVFDLAPKGMLSEYQTAIAQLARGGDYKE